MELFTLQNMQKNNFVYQGHTVDPCGTHCPMLDIFELFSFHFVVPLTYVNDECLAQFVCTTLDNDSDLYQAAFPLLSCQYSAKQWECLLSRVQSSSRGY